MLKKINRIKNKKDFEEIRNNVVLYHFPIFSVVVLKNLDPNDMVKKFGLIVSKKISKRAVDRNRIKRYLSLSIQKYWNDFKPNSKTVFLAKRVILDKKLSEIENGIKLVVEKII